MAVDRVAVDDVAAVDPEHPVEAAQQAQKTCSRMGAEVLPTGNKEWTRTPLNWKFILISLEHTTESLALRSMSVCLHEAMTLYDDKKDSPFLLFSSASKPDLLTENRYLTDDASEDEISTGWRFLFRPMSCSMYRCSESTHKKR